MTFEELKEFLDHKVEIYNTPNFIESDPIQIPHQFTLKEDIEIIGFLVATIAWGNRKMIIRNGEKLMDLMGNSPYDFVMSANTDKLESIEFVHRTFNSEDFRNFVLALRILYQNGGLEQAFHYPKLLMKDKLIAFNQNFTSNFGSDRSFKHVANPAKGSAAKRINMFLRWMVRKDNNGVDFGVWDKVSPSELHIPLDVHSGNMARKLGVLKRKQNDWKAVEEMQEFAVKLDPNDPCKYDFALFGLGVFEDF